MLRRFVVLLGFACLCGSLASCERKDPTFVARDAKAKESMQVYDLMKDQQRYIEYRKGDRAARAEAIRQLREAEERERGIYRRQSRWDY